MSETASGSVRGSRPWRAGAVAFVALAAFAMITPDSAAQVHAAPVNLKVALANLGRPTPPVQKPHSVGVIAAALTTGLPDQIFAQGFDNANSQCIMNADCPPAAAECLFNACSDGLCATAPAVSGAACSAGVCDGMGSCVACLLPTDCPGSDSECASRTCTANQCGQTLAPTGTACSGGVCDGIGTCVGCLSANDCPATGSECILKSCTANTCTPTLAPVGSACSIGVCDGAGTCVQCLTAADCPAAPECKIEACTASVCEAQNAPSGTICSTGICDGMGTCISPP